ncbi:MAG: thioredoxin family protein, partial [Deltaproteobacteria bacterium]|nr:thioredoxin family protein [Deltaproteobacteria bacterium]
LCSAISCTPVKTQIEFTPADLSANSELLPDKLQKTLADYQIAPLAGQKASPATSPGISPADYSKTFAPQFFHAGLEVYGLAQAILLGFLAGFILNFMPCVLPVVSLKLGTLAGLGGLKSLSGQPGNNEQAKRIQGRLRTYSLFFSLGVFIWFAALFAVIGLAGMMWGQFFQSEKVLLAMVIILFLLALSLFGVFHLPLLHVAYENTDPKMESAGKPGYGSLPRQAFAGGLLATLMATPCSGPLLGGVLSWAVGEPLPFLALALASVGLGMSAPFLLLALKPGLARFFPQPGPWNIILEKITAFLLLGTVLYLLSILQESGLIRILCALLLLSVAAWIWGHKATSRPWRSVPGLLTAALFAGLALYSVFTGQKTEQDAQIYPQQYTGTAWQNYTPELFSSVLGQQNILLDFTADWCINCRVMEATTLSDANRAQWQAKYKLTYMKADLTRENKPAEALLRAVGSTSIPVIVIFPTGEQSGKPVVLRDISTVGQVEEALKQTLDELK